MSNARVDLWTDAVELCGCGSDETWQLLEEVLHWCDNKHGESIEVPTFEEKGCYCSVAHELAAKVLDRAGLIEHGTGIGWPWTTEKGKTLIDALELCGGWDE